MALHRLIVFVFAAVALAGCCASGTGCPASLPPELATSDGLVSSRDDGMRVDEPSMGDRSKAAMMTEPGKNTRRSARSNANQSFDEKEAMDREADAELTRHLK